MGNAQRARVSLLGMNFRTVAAAVGISLLSACSAVDSVREVVVPPETPLVDVSEPSPSETEVPVEEVIEVVEPPEPESPSAEAWEDAHRDLEPQLVEPDPALVESMECLPVPEGSLEFATDSTQAGQNDGDRLDVVAHAMKDARMAALSQRPALVWDLGAGWSSRRMENGLANLR